jgi:hypothetical protein
MICKWGTKTKLKFKTKNEKDNYAWAFIDFFIIFLKWKMKRKSMMIFFWKKKKILLLFANINREVEDFDHVQVNRYEQTDDILFGWV